MGNPNRTVLGPVIRLLLPSVATVLFTAVAWGAREVYSRMLMLEESASAYNAELAKLQVSAEYLRTSVRDLAYEVHALRGPIVGLTVSSPRTEPPVRRE